jgi:hypothetical protein
VISTSWCDHGFVAVLNRSAQSPSALLTVRDAGDDERTAEETVVDGAQLDAPFGLPLFELLGTEHVGESIAMLVALVDPRLGDHGELGCAVSLLDLDEAGPLE